MLSIPILSQDLIFFAFDVDREIPVRSTFFLILAVASAAVHAASPIGRVVQISGPVMVGADPLTVATLLQPGMRLVSSKAGSVTLRMADDSLVRVDGATDLTINDFTVSTSQSTGPSSAATYELSYGSVRIVSGRVAPIGTSVVTLRTVFGDVVANTADYSAALCAGECTQAPGLYVCMQSGEANARASGGMTILRSGQASYFSAEQQSARIMDSCPTFMADVTAGSLRVSLDVQTPGIPRLRQEAQDFLSGVIDPPASPSQQPASNPR